MTWYFWFTNDGRDGHVADHNGDELPNSPWTNPDGWTWSGGYPDQIVDVMMDHAQAQIGTQNGLDYYSATVTHAIKGDIEQGQP